MGEWHTRAQVSTLLVPNAARTIFCTTYTSSLVQRDEVMPPTLSTPYSSWIARMRAAAKPIASSQLASRQGWSIDSRRRGVSTRSVWVA